MDWWLLTFFLGAILSLFLPEVPALSQLFLLLCFAIGFYCHKNLRYGSGLCFGALWILAQAYLYHNQLPKTFINLMQNKQSFVVEGRVLNMQVLLTSGLANKLSASSVQKKSLPTKRFNFLVSKINQQQLKTAVVIRLSWKKSTLEVAQGQRLTLKVKLKPVHGLSNIGGFNYLSWLKAHNIVATGYVVNPRKKQASSLKGEKGLNSLKKPIINTLILPNKTIRQQLFEQYHQITPEHKLSPILLALAFGERSLLTPEHWQVLQATGTSHLIAISGLHIGLLAGSAFFMVMLIFKYLPLRNSCWQRGNIVYLAIAVSVLMASGYAYLAGFSLPTQRALVMLNLYWFSRLVGIRFTAKRLILITLFILLIITPFSLFTASFWLSFYAVAIIFVSLWRFNSWLTKGSSIWRFFKGLFIIQVSLTVMLIPVSAFFFQKISLVSLLANIIAVPWMSVISIPSALISVLLIPLSEQVSQWFMMLSLQSLTWLWYYLELLSKQSYAIISLSSAQQIIVLIAGLVIFTTFYLSPFFWSKRIKRNIVFLLTSVLSISVLLTAVPSLSFLSQSFLTLESNIQAKEVDYTSSLSYLSKKSYTKNRPYIPWKAVFFDVGQGLSVLIIRNNHGILYDTGAAYPSGFTMSDAVILPYLQYVGIETLDKVILSHSDNDHAGGIKSLAENINIADIMSNDSAMSHFTQVNRKLTACNTRQSFSWQSLTFEILWPLTFDSSAEKSNVFRKTNKSKQKNDDSCVILITDDKGKKLLLTGDISIKVEQELLKLYPQLNIDILQVPHHGSKTSSSQAFLRQLSPELALVSAGFLNRWKMPVMAVSQRYHDYDIELLNSAELGQIILSFDEKGISRQSYVDDLRPFWFSH